MAVEFGLTDELVNTQYAPLAALCVHYQHEQILHPLEQLPFQAKRRDFGPPSKLIQIFLSLLAGCDTLSEVNPKLKAEVGLAQVWGWPRFADQSNLSRLLDQLTLKQLEQLRSATTQIWHSQSRAVQHDWRGYLWLDYDLSGLPCSERAEASQKGYFSGKKTPLDGNWRGSMRSSTWKPSGQMCSRATTIPSTVCSRPCWPAKML
jgi:hypothetical protein